MSSMKQMKSWNGYTVIIMFAILLQKIHRCFLVLTPSTVIMWFVTTLSNTYLTLLPMIMNTRTNGSRISLLLSIANTLNQTLMIFTSVCATFTQTKQLRPTCKWPKFIHEERLVPQVVRRYKKEVLSCSPSAQQLRASPKWKLNSYWSNVRIRCWLLSLQTSMPRRMQCFHWPQLLLQRLL